MPNPALPPGAKPGDSDPPKPEQKPLAGKVFAVVMFHVTCEIQGTSDEGGLGDECYTPAAAVAFMREHVLLATAPGISYEDLEFTDEVFEAD